MKIYVTPNVVSSGSKGTHYTTSSMGSTVAETVVGTVVGSIIGSMIPGPGIPG